MLRGYKGTTNASHYAFVVFTSDSDFRLLWHILSYSMLLAFFNNKMWLFQKKKKMLFLSLVEKTSNPDNVSVMGNLIAAQVVAGMVWKYSIVIGNMDWCIT